MKDVIAINEVCEELTSATSLYPSFKDVHEGWAIIYEEVDELWDLVKAYKSMSTDTPYHIKSKDDMRKEAKQIAAMALRFMIDLT